MTGTRTVRHALALMALVTCASCRPAESPFVDATVTSIRFVNSSLTVRVGESLLASVLLYNAADTRLLATQSVPLSYTSSSLAVATVVAATGPGSPALISALGVGSTVITATLTQAGLAPVTATMPVTVTP
ncbi:MAG: hypothetical protein NTU67_01205 [Gemmatimonadetes bacterium]|nr:hypothetical protein [Gemmatimonadota bacterium]